MGEVLITLAVEDHLSEAVLRVLLEQSGSCFRVTTCLGCRGNTYLKQKIHAFNGSAKGMNILLLTDLDTVECAPTLVQEWLQRSPHPNLLLRVAVREVEAWLLADRSAFARFLGVPASRIPEDVDAIRDPKEFVINLVRKSRYTNIKEAVVPRGPTSTQGPDYSGQLIGFVRRHWRVREAKAHSDSLRRALRAVRELASRAEQQ